MLLSYVIKLNAVCQHCKKNNILQNNKPAKFFSTKSHEYSPPWRITSTFLPLLIVNTKQTNKRKKANKMSCVSFVLMKLKSHFIGFSDERSLQRLSGKNTRAFHSLPLYLIVVSICVCSLSRLSQISLNANIRNVCEKIF